MAQLIWVFPISLQFPEYYVHRIPRSREVQQSWLSSVLTTLYSMWLSFPLTYRVKPDLVRIWCQIPDLVFGGEQGSLSYGCFVGNRTSCFRKQLPFIIALDTVPGLLLMCAKIYHFNALCWKRWGICLPSLAITWTLNLPSSSLSVSWQ